MIKVELFYKVTMHGTDWMMTEEEYKEFRETALNLPLANFYPTVKNHEAVEEIDFMGDPVDRLAEFIMLHVPGEPSRSEGAIDTAIRLLKERCEPADQAEECPDYIEPPAPEVICENGACRLAIDPVELEQTDESLEIRWKDTPETPEKITETPEKLPKTEEKVQKPEEKDFSPYVKMYRDKVPGREIQEKMVSGLGMTQGTANNYYYSKVKKAAEAEIEAEKKALEKKLEKNVQVIPPTVYEKPKDGKCFTDEDRLRLQKKVGIK